MLSGILEKESSAATTEPNGVGKTRTAPGLGTRRSPFWLSDDSDRRAVLVFGIPIPSTAQTERSRKD